MEIVANFAFWGPINRVTCMRKPQALNALTVWVFASDETRARRLTAAKLHGTSPRGEQSSTELVAEVQMDDCKKVSWVRNRNNEGQCDRFVKAEKSEEWMARSPVWPDDVIASEMASRHQPMNWRDSIWVQIRSRSRRSRCVKATQRRVTYEREHCPTVPEQWQLLTGEGFSHCVLSSSGSDSFSWVSIHNCTLQKKKQIKILISHICIFQQGYQNILILQAKYKYNISINKTLQLVCKECILN